jgi:hypothetical protein
MYFTDPAMFLEWSGRSLDWLKIELLSFYIYYLTMIFLLVRARCMTVGIDHSI